MIIDEFVIILTRLDTGWMRQFFLKINKHQINMKQILPSIFSVKTNKIKTFGKIFGLESVIINL